MYKVAINGAHKIVEDVCRFLQIVVSTGTLEMVVLDCFLHLQFFYYLIQIAHYTLEL